VAAPPVPRSGERLLRRWRSLRIWLELMRNLAVRDVETRYKHSLLGLYWTIINPLLMAAIYTFVFKVVMKVSSGSIPYVVFLITGLTFWNLFSNGIMSATGSITGSAGILAKLYFPRVVLPTAAVLARLIDFGFALGVTACLIAAYRVPVHWSALLLPAVVALQLCFTLGVAYAVAALNVILRDVSQIVGLLLMLWIYVSPVMFPAAGHSNALQTVLLANPMGAIIQAERDLLFTGHLTQPAMLWLAGAWTAFAFVGGLALFKRIEPVFAEVM
jgi:ABC-type polysaccharide/polyol phosphate export permease